MVSIQLATLLIIGFFANQALAFLPGLGIGSIAEAAAKAARERLRQKYNVSAINYPELLLAEPFVVTRVNVNASTRRLVVRASFIGGIDYHFAQDKLFWSDISTGRVHSRSLNPVTRSAAYLVDTVVDYNPLYWRPRAIAVDYVGNKLYVLDNRYKRLHVFELDGSKHTVILDGILIEPMDITLDPEAGFMFIADDTRIIRVNMDGTNPVALVGHMRYHIKSVTLDRENRRVYWADEAYHRIKRANYDGSDYSIVLKNERGKGFSLLGPANLAFHAGKLYFYDDMWRRISSVRVEPKSGRADESTYRLVYDRVSVRSMRLLHPEKQVVSQSPCGDDNGGCQGLCLITSKNANSLGYSCACPVGSALAEDLRSCL